MRAKHYVFLTVLVFIAALILIWFTATPHGGATVGERSEVIPTYPFSDPDPVPILTRSGLWGRGARLYPYYFFEGYSHTAENRRWKVVRIENPYIEVAVLPQVGGKVWGAVEKSTKREFIYTNHVLKFREIALRGPWTSGGIEFNFGIVGHTPAGATPVDYIWRRNSDGSASCIVGTTDWPSRTRWSVEITVPPDKAYFETRPFWVNPSPFHQSYYAWMNAAVRTGDDLQYVFPGRFHIGHDFSVPLKPWPVDASGRILSWYRNNDFGSSKSYFTVGEHQDFFGGYWHDAAFGFGHWAHYDDVPGHKVWIWSLARDGAIWEDLLTDDDGQYSEPQAGRYLNQNDHEFFPPYGADRWSEIWFPYTRIGPMTEASRWGVMNADLSEDSVDIGISALQKIDEDLVIKADGREIFRERIELDPMDVFEKTIPLKKAARRIEAAVGRVLSYDSNPESDDIRRPFRFHEYDDGTLESLFLQAERLEKQRNLYAALEKYRACLELAPDHQRALCRAAELTCRRGEYDEALAYAGRALEYVMYDPEANYVYGVIAFHMNRNLEAKEALGWAARSLKYRSGAYGLIAQIHLRESRPELAGEYALRALNYNTFNINALQVEAVARRLMNQPQEARRVLDRILEIEPLNHWTRFELYLWDPDNRRRDDFQGMIRNEMPHENYLEMALWYYRCGRDNESLRMLEMAPEHPMISYWKAFLNRERDPAASRTDLIRAREFSPYLVFPFREESLMPLEWALDQDPGDWKAGYYMGLILWGKGRAAEAVSALAACGDPDFAPFYLSRAVLNRQSDPEGMLSDLQQALYLERDSWRPWHYLISEYLERKMSADGLALAREAEALFPGNDTIAIDLVRCLMESGDFREALEKLKIIRTLPFEGARAVHELFVEIQVRLAMTAMRDKEWDDAIAYLEGAETYPENLGSGRPFHPDHRFQEFLRALCHEKKGETERAERLMRAIVDYTEEYGGELTRHQYFGRLALREIGEEERARLLPVKEMPEDAVLDVIRLFSR